MKNNLFTLFLIITLSGFGQTKDSLNAKRFEMGISLKKDFYNGENFINMSLNPQIGYELGLQYNLSKGYGVELYFFGNTNKIKSTEYIGLINKADLSGFGLKGKKVILIHKNLSFVPQLNLSGASFKYSMNNSIGNQKRFSTNGTVIGLDTAFRLKGKNDDAYELFGSFKHVFFQDMRAPSNASINYYATQVFSVGTRFSVGF